MPGYLTKQESVAIRGVDNLSIRSLLDKHQFADAQGAAEKLGISSAMWPLFGLLWPSGGYLAARMGLRSVVAAERILEVGCGLALASLVAHRRGADVTASDIHPLAEAFLLENLRLNCLAPMKYRHGDWAIPVAAVVAGCLNEDSEALPACVVRGRYDLIIGSDLLYDRDASGALAGFIALHAAPVAEIWIVDPNRGNRPSFNRRMAALGFLRHEERLAAPAALEVAAYRGRMLTYTRAQPQSAYETMQPG